MQSELDRANKKLDTLDALRHGAAEGYTGEREKLEQQKGYWLEEKRKWGSALLQPGNDFVTRALGTYSSVCIGRVDPLQPVSYNKFCQHFLITFWFPASHQPASMVYY